MKALLLLFAVFFMLPTKTKAQFLNEYRWKSRLVLVFTPSPDNPLFIRQMKLFHEAQEDFEERNVVFITLTPKGKHENTGRFLEEEASQQYYDYFGVRPFKMEVILIGLDSNEKLRTSNEVMKPSVILNTIDQMPMRRQEVLRQNRRKGKVDGGQ